MRRERGKTFRTAAGGDFIYCMQANNAVLHCVQAVAAKQEMERKLEKETEALNETRGKLEVKILFKKQLKLHTLYRL